MQMSFTGERYVPELRGQIYYEHFHRYAMVLELARDKDVLDIACGEGYGTAALALVARSALGVDVDTASVRHAAARYTAMNIGFRSGQCTEIPAADASFDLVVSFETIEHLTEQERMLSEIRRVLRPAGRLVISSPNKLVYSDQRAVKNPFHERELYFDEFRDMLRAVFPSVRVFGQRIFAASAVHPLRGSAQRTRWLGPQIAAENAMGALPEPEYFIAVCGRAEDDDVPDLSSIYLDPRDELLDDVRTGGLSGSDGGSAATLPGGERRALAAGDGYGRAPASSPDGGAEPRARIERLEAELRERETAGERLEARLRERDAAAEQLEARLRERDAQLQERAAAAAPAAQLEARLREREERIVELETALRARVIEAGERVAQVQHMTEHADGLERLLNEQQRRTAELEARLEELSAQAAERPGVREATQELEERLQALSAELESERLSAAHVDTVRMHEARFLAQRITELETYLDEQRHLLADREDVLVHTAAERDELRGALARAGEALVAADTDGAALRTHAVALGAENAGLRAERDALGAQNAELRAKLNSGTSEVAARARECEELRAALKRAQDEADVADEARRSAERSFAEAQLAHIACGDLAQRAETAEALLKEVMDSTSWRLTLPARRVMGVLRARKSGR